MEAGRGCWRFGGGRVRGRLPLAAEGGQCWRKAAARGRRRHR